MMLSAPGNSSLMDCAGSSFRPGCGPLGLAFEISPLPLATKSWRPSCVTRTEVGYQPTGMNPREWLCPRLLTSNTAMLLLQALATNNFVSSGDSARLLGVEPGRAVGEREASSVSKVRPVAVSRTVTVLRLALATNKCRADLVSAISLGCSPVAQRSATWRDFKSITATHARAHKLTYKRWRFSSNLQA